MHRKGDQRIKGGWEKGRNHEKSLSFKNNKNSYGKPTGCRSRQGRKPVIPCSNLTYLQTGGLYVKTMEHSMNQAERDNRFPPSHRRSVCQITSVLTRDLHISITLSNRKMYLEYRHSSVTNLLQVVKCLG